MYNVIMMIDYIQSSKKQYVNATVTNETINKCLNRFVDKQTEFCKVIVNNHIDISKELFNIALLKASDNR